MSIKKYLKKYTEVYDASKYDNIASEIEETLATNCKEIVRKEMSKHSVFLEDRTFKFNTTRNHNQTKPKRIDNIGDDELDDFDKSQEKIFLELTKVTYPEQHSYEWFAMREQRITASDGGVVLGLNKYETLLTFLNKKVNKSHFKGSEATNHGTKFEHIATLMYERIMGVKVKEFGLIGHKNISYLGASPDGIVSQYKLDEKHKTKLVGRMLEIKVPLNREIKTSGPIKDGICPIYYWIQVQLQLECCDLEYCDFWQCDIREYSNREEFIKDTGEFYYMSKSTEKEKGCLLQLLPLHDAFQTEKETKDYVYSNAKYIYPPRIDMSKTEYDDWLATSISSLNTTHPKLYLDRIIYWKILKYHKVTIERDRKWFAENIDTYSEVWNMICYLKANNEMAEKFFRHFETFPSKNYKYLYNIAKQFCSGNTDILIQEVPSNTTTKYRRYCT